MCVCIRFFVVVVGARALIDQLRWHPLSHPHNQVHANWQFIKTIRHNAALNQTALSILYDDLFDAMSLHLLRIVHLFTKFEMQNKTVQTHMDKKRFIYKYNRIIYATASYYAYVNYIYTIWYWCEAGVWLLLMVYNTTVGSICVMYYLTHFFKYVIWLCVKGH